MSSGTDKSASTSVTSVSPQNGGTKMSPPLAGDSNSTSADTSSSQPVRGVTSPSATQVPNQQGEDQCVSPVPGPRYMSGHGGQAIDEAFKPEAPVGLALGHLAAYANTTAPPVHEAPVPPPGAISDEEEMALSSHAIIEWPDSHDQDWSRRVVQDANTESNN